MFYGDRCEDPKAVTEHGTDPFLVEMALTMVEIFQPTRPDRYEPQLRKSGSVRPFEHPRFWIALACFRQRGEGDNASPLNRGEHPLYHRPQIPCHNRLPRWLRMRPILGVSAGRAIG